MFYILWYLTLDESLMAFFIILIPFLNHALRNADETNRFFQPKWLLFLSYQVL